MLFKLSKIEWVSEKSVILTRIY